MRKQRAAKNNSCSSFMRRTRLMSFENWMIGAGIAALGLLVTAWAHVGRPWWRERRRKKPCKAYFVIRPRERIRQPYVVQDDTSHILKSLTLPSHSSMEIEMVYRPQVPFRLVELIFG